MTCPSCGQGSLILLSTFVRCDCCEYESMRNTLPTYDEIRRSKNLVVEGQYKVVENEPKREAPPKRIYDNEQITMFETPELIWYGLKKKA